MDSGILIPFLIAIATRIVMFAAWLLGTLAVVFVCLWLLGTDFGKWCFEQLLDLIIYIMNGINFDMSFLSPSKFISIPPELGSMMSYLGIDAAIGIILAAIIVKIVLQLIPFTRLGS